MAHHGVKYLERKTAELGGLSGDRLTTFNHTHMLKKEDIQWMMDTLPEYVQMDYPKGKSEDRGEAVVIITKYLLAMRDILVYVKPPFRPTSHLMWEIKNKLYKPYEVPMRERVQDVPIEGEDR